MKTIPTTATHGLNCSCKDYAVNDWSQKSHLLAKQNHIAPATLPSGDWLTENIAYDICTAVVLGYSIYLKSIRQTAVFSYENDSDAEKHIAVKQKFHNLGVDIECVKLPAKSDNPLIVAGTAHTDTIQVQLSSVIASADFTNLRLSQPKYNQVKYYGAYIGGTYDNTETIKLIGVSQLEQYTSIYRNLTSAEKERIGSKFKSADFVSVKIDEFLNEISPIVLKNKNIKLNNLNGVPFTPMTNQTYDNSKGLFKSYHGMIRAMKLVPNPSVSNTTYYEISAGNDTNKVASCFPCASYMLSAQKPASAVHLGRGDNWNIPNYAVKVTVNPHESTPLKTLMSTGTDTSWAFDISFYYLLGLDKLQKTSNFTRMPHHEKFSNISNIMSKTIESRQIVRKLTEKEVSLISSIPNIFLESLTFEKSFTDRILNTLSE